jgi:hypothetical protein
VPLARKPSTATGKPAAEATSLLPAASGPAMPGRPAWTPMPVQPRTSGGNGVTVLGTTLNRRQTVIAGTILLAVIVVLILVASLLLFNRGDKTDNDRKGGALPGASAAKPTRTGAAAPAQPTQRTTSAAPSTGPASSAQVSSAPAGGGGVTLPAGWYLYKDSTGFAVPVPTGASISRQGSEVYFHKGNRLLIVDQTDQPQPDPVADWTNQEASRRGKIYKNYQRIRIDPVDYFTKAADWEFTYTTSSGNPQHAVKRGVITGPHQAYGLSWYTSPGDWERGLADLKLIYQGFKPKT